LHPPAHGTLRAACFDVTTSLQLLLSMDGVVLEANAAACAAAGAHESALVGRFCWEAPCVQAKPTFVSWLQRAIVTAANGEQPLCEIALNHPDGSPGVFDLTVARVDLAEQSRLFVEGRDVTVRARRETDIGTRERTQRLLTDNMSELLFLMRIDGDGLLRCESVNPAYVAVTGMPESQLIGRRVDEVLPPDGAAFALARYDEVIRTRQAMTYREDLPLPSGRLIVETRLTPVSALDGTITHLLGLARDVTAEVLASDAIAAAESRFRAVMESGLDAFVIARAERDADRTIRDFIVVDANAKAAALASLPVSALPGMSLLEAFPLSRSSSLWEQCCQVVETGTPLEITQFAPRAERASRWVLRQLVPIGDSIAIASRDITERTVERLALEASEARHRELFESNGAIQLLADATDARIIAVNPAAEAFYGWPRETMRSMLATDLDGMSLHEWQTMSDSMTVGSGRRYLRAHRVANRDTRQVEAFTNVVQVDGRRVVHIFIQDVTDRARALQRLHESEALFRAVISGMREGLVIHDATGAIGTCNPAAERILGMTLAQLHGLVAATDRWEATHEDGTPWPQDDHPAFVALRNGESHDGVLMLLRRGDGERRWLSISAAPLLGPDNKTPHGAVAVFSDVTEERIADERQRQSQTLEAVGQLAGGIAHDFNNLLTVIRGATGFMSDALGKSSIHAEDLRAIERATERAEELTRRLLAVGRKQLLQRSRVDLNAFMREETQSERLAVPSSITLRHAYSLAPAVALLDRTRLLDAIVVLVRNAIAAMPDGGVLTIGTDVQARTRATGPGQAATDRRFAVLTVADTGVGMPDVVKARLFEPFFSTHPFGTGRGMGLATVHGMVAQSDGFMECESSPGEGTTIRLFFPEASMSLPSRTPRAVRAQSSIGRGVLVVDDDPLLRAVTRRMLEKLEYMVIVADSGQQALDVLDASPSDFGLLITDLTMPNMSGMTLIEHVQRRRPSMPIVAISGFALDTKVRDALADKQIRFVPKPFTADELSQAVEHALDAPTT